MTFNNLADDKAAEYVCNLWTQDVPERITNILGHKPDNIFEQSVHRTYDAFLAGFEAGYKELKGGANE